MGKFQNFPAIISLADPYLYQNGPTSPESHKGAKTVMLSTLISLYKLLGAGNFAKVLLILLKGLFG